MRRFQPLTKSSDADLLAHVAEHDPAAFTAFYRRYLGNVLRYFVRETRDLENAADLTAEVFAAVILAASRFQPNRGENASAWLFGIARNKLGDSRRRGSIEAEARRQLGFQPLTIDDIDLERIEDIASGHDSLGGLIDGLPDSERHAVVERVVNERTYGELARELECSEMVVRKRVSRGLARIRDQILERDDERLPR